MFAEKLGLETGWNCHISLAPCEKGHYDGGSVNASGSLASERDCLLRGSKSNIAQGICDATISGFAVYKILW